jgi:hypothetical protein
MNRSQALKEAVRRWGKTAVVEDKGAALASTPERRAAAAAEGKRLRESMPKDRRLTREEREAIDHCLVESYRRRYMVGTVSTLGPFSACLVHGWGDTWEEAFAEAEKNYPAKVAA